MVATQAEPIASELLQHVSIPIGFSNGCNRHPDEDLEAGPGFQSLSGFLMVATRDQTGSNPQKKVSIPIGFSNGCNEAGIDAYGPLMPGFNPYRVF